MIPTREMCEQLWHDAELPEGLIEHQTAVAELSVRMGAALNKKGCSLAIPLMEAAALLHDIKKGVPHHAQVGAHMLEARGFAEIAPIVRAHMRLPDGFRTEITELTVVFLADKLLIGSKAVSLTERYAQKMSTFRGQASALQTVRNQYELALNLERQIKTILGIDNLACL